MTPADLLRSGAREKRRRQLPGKVPAGTRRARPPCIVERGDDDCEVVKVPTGTGRARPPCIVERGDTVKSFFLWVRVQGVIAACRGYGAATYHARPLTVKRKVRSRGRRRAAVIIGTVRLRHRIDDQLLSNHRSCTHLSGRGWLTELRPGV